MGDLTWVLYIAGALLALQYVVAPVLVRFAVRSPRTPDIRRADESEIEPEVQDYFESVRPELTTLGFRPVGRFRVDGFTRGQTWFLEAYTHDRNLDGASANFVYQQVPKAPMMKTQAVAFLADFEGGRMLGTSNSADPTPFLRPGPTLREQVVPGERDLSTLYRVHRAAAEAFSDGRPQRRPPSPGAELEALRDSLRRQMEARVESGHFRLDEQADAYRLTWTGALLSTWSMLWPWKSLRVSLARRRAAKWLQGRP